ncbi:hypothetical protein M9Y10_028639 [Tritrichomonas musculus]|uniref:BEACH domain-containing protein n=1 Tax=Tritrichomonas musculus TaxID=1915356 RepID=A0ABR2KJW6_9EUKA
MLHNLGNFFFGTKQKQEEKQIPPISQDDKFQINMFSQNLDAFSTISRDSTCGPLFSRLVNQFSSTFKNIKPDHLYIEEIKIILEKYCQLCSELGILALHDKSNLLETLFNSLTFTSSLFGYIPHCDSFFSFFCGIIQEIKKKPMLFNKSIQFLTCLFKSTGFFTEFLANDGFSLIFSSFFIQENVDSQQENFLRLLFKTVSMEYFKNAKMKSKVSNLKFFTDLLSHQIKAKYTLKNSCLFLTYYIIAFLPSDQTLITAFNSYSGFTLLNNLFIHNCPEIAHECYEILMIETDLDQIVLSSMNQLFLNKETGTELRSSLIPLLSVQTNSINATYQKLSAIIPLTKYLLRPPSLDKKSLITLSQIISSFINNNSLHVEFKQFLNPILNLIKFPENEQIPADSYFQLLIDAINDKKITCDTLVQEKFLPMFLLEPQPHEIASYYQHYKVGLQLFLNIYGSDSCSSETRYQIFHKFLQSAQFLTEKAFYVEFISSLLSFQLSHKIYKLLLMFIKNEPIVTLLIKESKKHSLSFDYFIKNDGFLILDNFLDELQNSGTVNTDKNNEKYVNIMKLLSSLAYFSPHQEIDEWLNKQPVDSKLFTCCSTEFLSQMAIGFSTTRHLLYVPSLLPFISDFDSSSPYNLFLAGKFGVPACIKRKIPIEKIPHISKIANRYISSNVAKMLFDQTPKMIKDYINPSMPHFSLFEFIPTSDPAYIIYEQQYSSLSFWYYTPYYSADNSTSKKKSIFKSKFQLVNCQITTIEIIDNETLLAKTNRDKLTIPSSSGKWHHVVIIFHMRRNVAYKCEIILDRQHIGFLKIDLQTIPSSATFGHKKLPIPAPLLISSNVFLTESMINEEQINSIYKVHLSAFTVTPSQCWYSSKSGTNVVFVNYLGFASYFRSSINIEKLFALLEKVGSNIDKKNLANETSNDLIEQFKSIYLALLNLQNVNRTKFSIIWGRMILSFCRCKELIEETLHYYACDLIDVYYSSSSSFISPPKSISKRVTTAIFLLLSDVEIYSIFSYDSIKQYFAHILELNTVDWKLLELLKITEFLMTALRSGIDDNFKLMFVPLLSRSTQVEPTSSKLRLFFNSVMSVGDWTYNVVDLIHENVSFSHIQHKLLSVFVNSAKVIQDTELYTLNQILLFMMLFLDERAICLAELIAIYSYRNPKYISTPNHLLSYVFSTMAIENNKIWKVAFSILSGNMPLQKFIKGFQIRRPQFLPVILDMLNALAANCAHLIIENEEQKDDEDEETKTKKKMNDHLINLFTKVIHVLLSLDKSQFPFFSQPQCLTALHSLLFLGITPNSYSADEKSERTIKIWTTFSIQPPTKSEIKQIINLTTQSSLFSPIVPENLCYEPKAISSSSKSILYFPDDFDEVKSDNETNNNNNNNSDSFYNGKSDDCILQLDDLMKSSLLLDLFVSIIIESESMSSLFLDLISGNALMYNRYSKMIAQELVLAVLARFSSSHYFINNSYFSMINNINNSNGSSSSSATGTTFNSLNFINLLKNAFSAVHRTAVTGVFNDKYLTFLTAVLEVVSQPSIPQQQQQQQQQLQLPSVPSSPNEKGRKRSFNQQNDFSSSSSQAFESLSSSAPTSFLSSLYSPLPNSASASPQVSASPSSANSSTLVIDLLLADDKFVKMYKDILLSAFCYISEGDSHPLFQLLVQYKEAVFKPVIFGDKEFSSLWLHVTRPRGGNAPERIECMTAFMRIIDNTIMSAYSPMEVQAEWISFKTSKNGKWMNNYFDSVLNENEYKTNRINRMNAIIEWKQKCYTYAAKYELFSRIYRSCNFSVEQNMVIQNINLNQRLNEKIIFKFSLLARKREMQSEKFIPASYHLSPLSFPVCQSRALSPSPFSIKSPSLTSKVPKSFFIPFNDYEYEEYNEDEEANSNSNETTNNKNNNDSQNNHINKSSNDSQNNSINKNNNDSQNNSINISSNEGGAVSNDSIATDNKEASETSNDNISTSNNSIDDGSDKNSDDKSSSANDGDDKSIKSNDNGGSNDDLNVSLQSSVKRRRRRRHHESEQRIKAINQRGLMNCSPEWSYFGCHEETRPFYSPFEYSAVIEQGPSSLLNLFETAFQEYGPFTHRYDVNFFYFIHPLPSVLFITNTALVLVVLAKGELQLISHPQNPVAFLPFTESVALGEFTQTSLFCGHVVIITRMDKIVRIQRHFYVHKKVGLCISTIGASNLILLFSSHSEMTSASKLIGQKTNLRRSYPPSHILYTIQTLEQSTFLWQNNVISNFDYLMLLNAFGGRSFADLSQYPVVPWVVSPTTLEARNLTLPMGQLNENRARHYDQTYELSSPLKYYYGFHYSLPGIVFWFLMRLPPFTFFQWDLNNGWDNSQRLFISVADAWNSAAVSNPSDLKELIPAMYQTPEALVNLSNIKLSVPDNVTLPEWSKNNPYYFSENGMKYLNESQSIHSWINLIFGFQQSGEAAIEAKNLFHPSAYRSCKCEDVEMDEDAFRSQVLNFGQCPFQLFHKPHPTKMFKAVKKNWNDVTFEVFDLNSVDVLNPLQLQMKTHLYSAIWISGKSVGKQLVLLLPLTMMKKKIAEMNKRHKKQKIKKSICNDNVCSAASTVMIPMECSTTYYYFDVDQESESLSLFIDSLSKSQNDSNSSSTKSSVMPNLIASQMNENRQSRHRFKTTMAKSPSFSFIDNLNIKTLNTSQSNLRQGGNNNDQPLTPRQSALQSFKKAARGSVKAVVSSPLPSVDSSRDGSKHRGIKEESSLNMDEQSDSLEDKSVSQLQRKPVFVKYSYDFALVNHLSVSDDGFFLVISFDFGLVDIYQIVFERGKPIDINKFSSFVEFGSSCKMSSVFSQDYLCASVFVRERFDGENSVSIVMWNIATQMRHRSIKLDFTPIQIAFDQFNGVLTVLGQTEVRQYSSNAVLLRTFKFDMQGYPSQATKSSTTKTGTINNSNTKASTISNSNANDTNNSGSENSNTTDTDNNGIKSGGVDDDDDYENDTYNSILICNNNHYVSNRNDRYNDDDIGTKKNKSPESASSTPVVCTCMTLLGLDFTFNNRLIVIGQSNGNVTILAADQKTYDFLVVKRLVSNSAFSTKSGIVTITSSVTTVPRFSTVDERGVVRVVEISAFDPRTRIMQCSFCENPQTTVCVKCQMPLCDSCRYEGTDLCTSCAQGSDILNFGHY